MVNNIRTVSDTKRDFYTHHTRPINSIYRRVVEELMVEMHLLAVNADFRYDPIYALGMVTSFDKFMQGYRPEQDKDSIFAALCQAVGGDAPKYRHDSKQLQDLAARLSGQEIIAWLSQSTTIDDVGELQQSLRAIADNPNFKYSRLFAIGLFTLLELADSDLVKDEKQRNEVFQQISEPLHLPNEKLQKDLEIYLGNLEKMAQVRVIMEDTLIAERKKRDQRTQDAGIEVVPTKDGD